MEERRKYSVQTWVARGKPWVLWPHAEEGMACERPKITMGSVETVLEHPDHDDGTKAWKRFGKRTIIVYYDEAEDIIEVQSVSATRGRFPPKVP